MHPQLNYMIARQRLAELARISEQRRIRNEVPVERPRPGRSDWIAVAAVLMGAGWGSNQFPPMLVVYRHTVGLGAGSLEAMFGVYALGLIPALLLAGPLLGCPGPSPAGPCRGGDVVAGEPPADRRRSLAGAPVRGSVRGRAQQRRGVQRGNGVAA